MDWAGRKPKDENALGRTKASKRLRVSDRADLAIGRKSKTKAQMGRKQKVMNPITKQPSMSRDEVERHMDNHDPHVDSLSQVAALADEAQDPYQRGFLMGILGVRQALLVITGRS